MREPPLLGLDFRDWEGLGPFLEETVGLRDSVLVNELCCFGDLFLFTVCTSAFTVLVVEEVCLPNSSTCMGW